MGWKTAKWPFVDNIGLFLCLSLRGWREFCRQVFPLLASRHLSLLSSPSSSSSPLLSRLPLLFITLGVSSSSSISHYPHPKVQLQVHIGHYKPAERYSPPLSPHLSLSASLSFSLCPASVWSLLVLRDKLLPSCLRHSLPLSLYLSILYTFFLLCAPPPFLPLLGWFSVFCWPWVALSPLDLYIFSSITIYTYIPNFELSFFHLQA